jgi:sirohydrochlorin ferrochelatase
MGTGATRRSTRTSDDDFDPFLHSPLSFGPPSSSSSSPAVVDDDIAAGRANFGFLSYDECNIGGELTSAAVSDDDLLEFDPLLSPHVYVNGVDAGRIPPPPSPSSSPSVVGVGTRRARKVGIILIDHGSKRSASNEHIHDVARMYERILKDGGGCDSRDDHGDTGGVEDVATITATAGQRSMKMMTDTTVVRAAHMELAAPSILDALRDVLLSDGVTEVVCVPYFLSPGRHATEDVPNLIAEARDVLGGEGLLSSRERRGRLSTSGRSAATDDDAATADDDEILILVSDALGTHLEGMLGAVDHLVKRTLNR